ncbi:hypothetical protein IID19_03185 [Patescibacteria group bacterium]|nr:hypothetical protein [Patescibacteria group bacterium]
MNDMNGNDQSLTKRERRKLRRDEQSKEFAQQGRKHRMKSVASYSAIFIAVAGVIYGITVLAGSGGVLPPKSMNPHIEASPSAHIIDTPMPLSTYRHMFEHSDGEGPPGVHINYNCEDFDCSSDLIDKLTSIAEEYPEFVYLSPFENMSSMIVVTRLGKQEAMEQFDEERIVNFIKDK